MVVFEFLRQNWSLISSCLITLIFSCSVIVRLTPSVKDDGFIKKIINILDKFSIAKTANDKELLEKAKNSLSNKS